MNELSSLDKFFLTNKAKLPDLPASALQAVNIVQGDDSSMRELALTISVDPNLTARILKIVNSPLYNTTGQNIEDLETALSRLGVDRLKEIIISATFVEELRNYKSSMDYVFYCRVELTTAVIAKLLAGISKFDLPDIFIASFLKDIGTVLMSYFRDDDYRLVRSECPVHTMEIITVEQRIFGFNHAELGMKLIQMWDFPESIYMPVGLHVAVGEVVPEYREIVDLIQIATQVDALLNNSERIDAKELIKIKDRFKEKFAVKDYELVKLLDDIANKSMDILACYDIPKGDIKPYSQVLQDSFENVSDLNSAYEALLDELQHAKQSSKDLTDKLGAANEELEKMAYKDSLTGLFNHRFFHETFDAMLSNAKRHFRPFALITFDLDKFKAINDNLGHKYGDEVLKKVSYIVNASVRDEDIVARIGGDEFSILLPETDLCAGAKLAERIRANIETAGVEFESEHKFGFSVSLGVGAYLPENKEERKEQLIQRVDKALYISKETGKNRVTKA